MKNQKKIIPSLALFFLTTTIQAQTGGDFTITQSVIAAGGENSAGGDFLVDATTGQAVAGGIKRGGQFAATTGFWTFNPPAPTAAMVRVGGQITTFDGEGIGNVEIVLTDLSEGRTEQTFTSDKGTYRFDGVEVTHLYQVTIKRKFYVFEPNIQIFTLSEAREDVDFRGYKQRRPTLPQ